MAQLRLEKAALARKSLELSLGIEWISDLCIWGKVFHFR